MSDPTVCCIMLTRDRPEMARREVECFRAQTYHNKRLLIYDTGEDSVCDLADAINVTLEDEDVEIIESQACNHHGQPKTIGYLRNRAVHHLGDATEIISHWDDDDWSHPNRIAEQVALLQSSGAECVGYREVLFWRTPQQESWLYSVAGVSSPIGSSFCYWRSAWERNPFPDAPKQNDAGVWGSGEDMLWRRRVKCHAVTSFGRDHTPRMVCRIHGGNTMPYDIDRYPGTWKRAPEWDEYCRGVLA